MNYTMNPNDAVFDGIKDKVILNNEEAISHINQFFLPGYLAHKGIGGEKRLDRLLSILSATASAAGGLSIAM